MFKNIKITIFFILLPLTAFSDESIYIVGGGGGGGSITIAGGGGSGGEAYFSNETAPPEEAGKGGAASVTREGGKGGELYGTVGTSPGKGTNGENGSGGSGSSRGASVGDDTSGGAGGVLSHSLTFQRYDTILIKGGDGGEGAKSLSNERSGGGGNGGNISISTTNDIIAKNITLQGGNGANGGNIDFDTYFGGSGGNGGSAIFSTENNVTIDDQFFMISGDNGNDGTVQGIVTDTGTGKPGEGGSSGKVSFHVNTFSAQIIELSKKDDNFNFYVNTLDVSKNNTLIILENFDNEILFNEINIGNERTLGTREGGNPVRNFKVLNIFGKNTQIKGNLDAQDKTLNFVIPPTMEKESTMLNVIGNANIKGSIISAEVDENSILKVGDKVVLIEASSITGTPANSLVISKTGKDNILKYKFKTEIEGSKLVATIERITQSLPYSLMRAPGANCFKVFSQGHIASNAFVNQGADLVANSGIKDALFKTQIAGKPSIFSQIQVGKSKYKTGSHFNIGGISLVSGISAGCNLKSGYLVLGSFFEFGSGNYDSYDDFPGELSIEAKGNVRYVGGGILGHFSFCRTDRGYLYVETSGRAGNTKCDFDSNDLQNSWEESVAYSSSSMYYGCHIGSGYVLKLFEKNQMDIYYKYFWNHRNGNKFNVFDDKTVELLGFSSNRLNVGVKLSYNVNSLISPYIGTEYEHEITGDINARIYNLDIETPCLKGNTYKGEIGLSFGNKRLSANLGFQGYAGRRKGYSITMQIKYRF
ncbi:MAG: hypothetical protein LBS83_02955 [Holosporales bacterium]|nr:hypothetical protein [Holosporales bacterium]